MRLQLEENVKTEKISKKKVTKKKLTETDKLYNKLTTNYSDTSTFKYSNIDIPINKLQYNHIICCKPEYIITENGVIDTHSWVELIMMLLDTFKTNAINHTLKFDIINKPKLNDDFKKSTKNLNGKTSDISDIFIYALAEYEITQREFSVDKLFGKTDFSQNIRAFRLYDSNYYIESALTPNIIFDVIVKIINALNMSLEQTAIHLVTTLDSETEVEEIQLNTIFKTIDNIYKNSFNDLKTNRKLVSVVIKDINGIDETNRIDGNNTSKRRTEEIKFNTETELEINRKVVFLLCKYLVNNYDIDSLQKLTKHRGKTRITIGVNIGKGEEIKKGDISIYAYTDSAYASIYEFIQFVLSTLDIEVENIKFKYELPKKKKTKKELRIY